MSGKKECATGADGKCTIAVPKGEHTIRFNTSGAVDSTGTHLAALDYLFVGTNVLRPLDGLSARIKGDDVIDAPLGQGPLMIPMNASSYARTYNGWAVVLENGEHHKGLDYQIHGSGPQPIYAPVTGKLTIDQPDDPWNPNNTISIGYKLPDGKTAYVNTSHLTEVDIPPVNNSTIAKGTILGYVNPDLYTGGNMVSGTSVPHIHLSAWTNMPGHAYNDNNGPWQLVPTGEWGWTDPSIFFACGENPAVLYPDR